ncbi:hypothetical protein KY289_028602 [Solanum tuberosum]|nr:hypothetical protein KY289_028602 [Solanum tuberosum]
MGIKDWSSREDLLLGNLRRYVNEYVICNGCKSPATILSKENRLFFLRCEKFSLWAFAEQVLVLLDSRLYFWDKM